VTEFGNLPPEWRCLSCELYGTMILVLAGAGPMVVDAFAPGSVPHSPVVVFPGLMVMAVVVSPRARAYLNPAVGIAFALRKEFPWQRVPGQVVAQPAGTHARAPRVPRGSRGAWRCLGRHRAYSVGALPGAAVAVEPACVL